MQMEAKKQKPTLKIWRSSTQL